MPWTACINVPTLAGYLLQDALAPNVTDIVKAHIPETTTQDDLRHITRAVTECLTSTCSLARTPEICSDACSSVNLLTNETMPNYAGLNACMFSLCTNGYNAVPFANSEILGIGVS